MKKYYLALLFIFGVVITITIACQNPAVMNQSAAKENINLAEKSTFNIVVISDLNSQYGSTDYEPEIDVRFV